MSTPRSLIFSFSVSLSLAVMALTLTACPPAGPDTRLPGAASGPRYDKLFEASPDGIGKVYQGREIARVMGHQVADWLDRPEREQEERTDLLLNLLSLTPGLVVADVGAGSGTLTLPIARRVAPGGRVLAVDIQPEMLSLLGKRAAGEGLRNVELVLGREDDPQLPPGTVDLALLVDSYHEFEYPWEMVQGLRRGLKAGGKLVLVEYRGEDPAVPIKPLHKMTEAQVRREIEPLGFRWLETRADLPRQHLVVFEKVE